MFLNDDIYAIRYDAFFCAPKRQHISISSCKTHEIFKKVSKKKTVKSYKLFKNMDVLLIKKSKTTVCEL